MNKISLSWIQSHRRSSLKLEQLNKTTGIAFKMNARTNRLLSKAAKKTKRSKRVEAAIRLEDHLLRFPTIAEIIKDIAHESL